MSPRAKLRVTAGKVAVASETPKRPIGNCIRRKAQIQPRAAAVDLGGEDAVDQHVHLHRRAGDHAGPHQRPQLAQARVAQSSAANGSGSPSVNSDGSCMRELGQAAQQHAEADAVERALAEHADAARSARAPGSKAKARPTPAITETMLNTVEAEAGTPKTKRAFSIPITAAASETNRMKGNRMPGQADRQLELARHVVEAEVGDLHDQRRGGDGDDGTGRRGEDHRASRSGWPAPRPARRPPCPRCG